MSGVAANTAFEGAPRDREPKPVAADVAFISTADDTGVGDK